MKISIIKEEFRFNNECRKLTPQTIINYDRMLSYLVRFLEEECAITEVEDVKAKHIRDFLKKMQETKHTTNYLNDLLKVFRVFFRYASDEEYIVYDSRPTKNVKNIRKEKVIIQGFSQTEMKKMIEYYSGRDYLSIRNKLILMMFWDTGIRCSELTGMDLGQIHNDYILIHGKGAKDRVVPKSPMLSKWLMKYLAVRKAYFEYRPHSDLVFMSRNGRVLTTEMIDRRIIGDAASAVGVRDEVRTSAHTIRHAFAEFSLSHGMDIYSLSRLLGHSNISTTQIYLEGIRDKDILSMAEQVSPLMMP